MRKDQVLPVHVSDALCSGQNTPVGDAASRSDLQNKRSRWGTQTLPLIITIESLTFAMALAIINGPFER